MWSPCNLHFLQSRQVQRQGNNDENGDADSDADDHDHVGEHKDIKTKSQFQTEDRWRVLSLGQFFFVKIWPANNDLLSVAELQLLWEDKVGDADHHDDDHHRDVWMFGCCYLSSYTYMFPRNGGKNSQKQICFHKYLSLFHSLLFFGRKMSPLQKIFANCYWQFCPFFVIWLLSIFVFVFVFVNIC